MVFLRRKHPDQNSSQARRESLYLSEPICAQYFPVTPYSVARFGILHRSVAPTFRQPVPHRVFPQLEIKIFLRRGNTFVCTSIAIDQIRARLEIFLMAPVTRLVFFALLVHGGATLTPALPVAFDAFEASLKTVFVRHAFYGVTMAIDEQLTYGLLVQLLKFFSTFAGARSVLVIEKVLTFFVYV